MSADRERTCTGIIAECNPFHDGHRYLMKQVREAFPESAIITVMSGDFTQRGMPAVENKWERAAAMIEGGSDLVFELPAVYACASAPFFAEAGTGILEALGVVDRIAFGSEAGNAKWFRDASSFFRRNDGAVQKRIAMLTKEGVSWPRARERAAAELAPDFDVTGLRKPNNILGLEYALHGESLGLFTVPRNDAGYHASGTALRNAMRQTFPERFHQAEDRLYRILVSKILSTTEEALEQTPSAGGGLGHLLKKKIRCSHDLHSLTVAVKSKVYTHTRITRLFAQILLGITRDDLLSGILYARLLAADQRGRSLLREIRSRASIPVLTNINREVQRYPEIRRLLSIDILASDLSHLIRGEDLYQESDQVRHPVMTTAEQGEEAQKNI